MKPQTKGELKKSKLRLMRWFNIAFTFLVLMLSSCRNESTYPKPKSYLRIDLPEKGYYKIENNTCPFSFEIPNYATWQQRFKNNNSCSKAVLFPQFNAEILCDYIKLENDIVALSEVFRNKMYDHSFKSTGIIERSWSDAENKVYGITYGIKGNTACNFGFLITDSTKHAFLGQLMFQTKPNFDSLSPMINFITDDAEKLIESFRWIN